MGYSPWSLKELDTTERLSTASGVGGHGGGSQASVLFRDPQVVPVCSQVWEPLSPCSETLLHTLSLGQYPLNLAGLSLTLLPPGTLPAHADLSNCSCYFFFKCLPYPP